VKGDTTVRGESATRLLMAAVLVLLAGCATLGLGSPPPPAPTSIQTLEYYSFQVKGYQDSYPKRDILVLMPVDARDFADAATPDHEPLNGNPAIGYESGKDGSIVTRFYAEPLAPVVQKALAASAEEAGMTAKTSTDSVYAPGKKMAEDYVLASKITRCWVKKRRAPDGQYGPVYMTAADFAVDVRIFKPPFSALFWEGSSQQPYNDPPVGSFGLGPEDEAGIYDEPGQVLSVALTRAVAGVWEKNELHSLVLEDQVRTH
jgi:hypothetical protein